MPVDMRRYPADWRAISAAVRQRAGNVCEECGAPNGQVIYRRPGTAVWLLADDADHMNSDVGTAILGDDYTEVRVVLTVHHKGIAKPDGTPGDRHDKHDCRPENLAALCQRCHLLADLDIHVANAAATRRRKRAERGQLELAVD